MNSFSGKTTPVQKAMARLQNVRRVDRRKKSRSQSAGLLVHNIIQEHGAEGVVLPPFMLDFTASFHIQTCRYDI
jgi:hypothetical protein